MFLRYIKLLNQCFRDKNKNKNKNKDCVYCELM